MSDPAPCPVPGGLPDALVLAGGRSSRLGRDKAAARVGGLPLLDRVLRAAAPVVGRLVVVGPERPLLPGTAVGPALAWCREDPPGGGPVAAVAAGLRHVRAERVFVLAVDLPFLTADALAALAAAGPAAIAVDGDGRDQGLLGIWRTADLHAVLPPDPAGRSWRRVTGGIEAARVRLPGRPAPETDCDTADELAAAGRAMARAEAAGNTGPVTDTPATAGDPAPAGDPPPAGRPAPAADSAPRGNALADWVQQVRAELDLPEVDVRDLLDLARDVAHGVARPAAPLTTFLVGLAAGRAGGSPADVAAVSERVRALLPAPAAPDGDGS